VWLRAESWRPGEKRSKGDEEREMICVSVEIREGAITRQMRVTAPSIARALRIAGDGKPGHRVRLVFPIDLETFFVPGDHDHRVVA
jgi:hypothetical protein